MTKNVNTMKCTNQLQCELSYDLFSQNPNNFVVCIEKELHQNYKIVVVSLLFGWLYKPYKAYSIRNVPYMAHLKWLGLKETSPLQMRDTITRSLSHLDFPELFLTDLFIIIISYSSQLQVILY